MGCVADRTGDVETRAIARAKGAEGAPQVTPASASAPHGHEALRRAALEAVRGSRADAYELKRRYAEACVKVFAAPVPLLWPRRTRGRALRIVVVRGPSREPAVDEALKSLSGLPPESFRIAFVGVDAPFDAKRLAALDGDVLLDLAGVEADVGPLLARRPARAIVTVGDLEARNAPPLIDDERTAAADLANALVERCRALPPDCEVPDAAGMAKLWTEAVLQHQRGELAAARHSYAHVLSLQPGYAPAHYLLGIAQKDAGDLASARRSLTAAVEAAPGFVEARVAAARMAQAEGDSTGAVTMLADGIVATATPLALHRALGMVLLASGDGARAALAFANALGIDPTDAETHYNHGVALQMQRRSDEAAAAYRRSLALRPDMVAAEFNLATLCQEQGAADEAAASYRRVLARDPADAAAYKNLGEVYLAAGRIESWQDNFDRFEARCGNALPLAVQALEVLQHRGDFDAIDRYLERLARGEFTARTEAELCDCLEQLLYLLLFFDVDPAVVLRYAKLYDGAAPKVYGAPVPRRATRAPGRIRVGYLSADLRNHVMGKMMWQGLHRHDRERFSLHFYSLSRERDEWTGRFEALGDSFVELADLREEEAALRIAGDDLDLLVDLSTHTKGAKPGILARKPARVVLTHVASAGTVGLSAIDFKLTDRHADLASNQAFQLETLLPMDGCVYPLRRVAPARSHPFERRLLGIDDGTILIGAFVTAQKLSRRCLRLWRDVLKRAPRAKLAFSPANPAFRDAYVRLAEAGGIAQDRLCFVPQGEDDAHNQARYGLIDFVLDPMPFGGVNGTLEAIDMNVPVVTLVGKRHGERTGYSILANLGVTATIAHSEDEYVGIACRLATDAAFMESARAAIRTALPAASLADPLAYAQSLERAYVEALAAKAPEALG
jgi:predicted O-linked N-acetylglucosamine transferase (SPINDLY family)